MHTFQLVRAIPLVLLFTSSTLVLADPPVPYPNMSPAPGGSKVRPHKQDPRGSSGDESGSSSGVSIYSKSNDNNKKTKKGKKKKTAPFKK